MITAERCGHTKEGKHTDHNSVIITGGFITDNTTWKPNADMMRMGNTGQACVITKDQPAWDTPTYDCHDNQCDLSIRADRIHSKGVAEAFKSYALKPNAKKQLPHLTMCNDETTFPSELNFAFCGHLVEGDVEYPVCLAQGWSDADGGRNNWYVASESLYTTCDRWGSVGVTDSVNVFEIYTPMHASNATEAT